MIRLLIGFCVAAALLPSTALQVRAADVYSQNFDSGSATFTTNDVYWLDQTRANGFITATTNTVFGG